MGPLRAEVEVDVPRSRAFESIADLAARPRIMGDFVDGFRLTRIKSTGVGAGARMRFAVPLGATWMDTAIEEIEEPHRIIERGRGGRANRVPCTTVWELVEGPGALTTIRVVFWTSPSNPIDRLVELLTGASLWYRRGWQAAVERLREELESGPSRAGRLQVAGGNRYATGIP